MQGNPPRALAALGVLLFAGCTLLGDTPANPNLLAPKLVVGPRVDGNVTLFLHGAFREQRYDLIVVAVDNATAAERTHAYSVEVAVPMEGFYFDASAGVGAQEYRARARVDVDWRGERLLIATRDDAGAWDDPRFVSYPYELILGRLEAGS